MSAHPGDYLAKRMGRGRQCWAHCDKTPCGCPKSFKRIVRKRERQRVRMELLVADDPPEQMELDMLNEFIWANREPHDNCVMCGTAETVTIPGGTVTYWSE